MPNHFEFNADSFDKLLTGEDNSVSSPENDSPVTADTIGGENLLSHSSNDSDLVEPKESDQDKNIETSNNSDFLTSFLSEYGLKDGKVTYENDDGTTEKVDFDSLDSKEKINILKELTSPNLSKDEEEEIAKERIKEQEEQFNNFKTSLESQLNDFNSIPMDYKDNKSDSLQIEESEKEEIYKYILNQDENGATQFFKDLNDPKTLVELAWFALYGKEAISDITNYWKSQLKNTRKSVDNKPQTTVVSLDKNKSKDNFTNHHKSVETEYGENLL